MKLRFLFLSFFVLVLIDSAIAQNYFVTWTNLEKVFGREIRVSPAGALTMAIPGLGPLITMPRADVLCSGITSGSTDPDVPTLGLIGYEVTVVGGICCFLTVTHYTPEYRVTSVEPTRFTTKIPQPCHILSPFFRGSQIEKADAASSAPNRFFGGGKENTGAGANDYFAYALDPEGMPTTSKRSIFVNPTVKTALGATASVDGGMAVELVAQTGNWTLISRKLKDGVPAKPPFSWTVPTYSGYSPDITNVIQINNGTAGAAAQNIRYLVFRAFRNVGTVTQQSQIMIQTIDDATGKPTGPALALTNFVKAFQAQAETAQGIAISPDGRVVVATEYSERCKKQILKARELLNGVVVGAAKEVAGCGTLTGSQVGIIGIDITSAIQRDASSSEK